MLTTLKILGLLGLLVVWVLLSDYLSERFIMKSTTKRLLERVKRIERILEWYNLHE